MNGVLCRIYLPVCLQFIHGVFLPRCASLLRYPYPRSCQNMRFITAWHCVLSVGVAWRLQRGVRALFPRFVRALDTAALFQQRDSLFVSCDASSVLFCTLNAKQTLPEQDRCDKSLMCSSWCVEACWKGYTRGCRLHLERQGVSWSWNGAWNIDQDVTTEAGAGVQREGKTRRRMHAFR